MNIADSFRKLASKFRKEKSVSEQAEEADWSVMEEGEEASSTGIRRSFGRWLGWGVALALLTTWLILSVGNDSDNDLREEIEQAVEASPNREAVSTASLSDSTFQIIVWKEWSDPVKVPLMRQINWERSGDLAAIQVRNQFGDTKSLPRGPSRDYITFRGRLSALQFRVAEEEDADSVIIQVAISPIR